MMFDGQEGRTDVSRSFPLLAVMMLIGAAASLVAGFLLASWAVAGIVPAYAAPPAFARADPRDDAAADRWREAGYERIGLWEQPQVNDQADGSSRL
jgi:hypothetical protein